MAVLLEQRERVRREAQLVHRAVAPGASDHLGIEGVGETDRGARPRRLADAQLRDHVVPGGDALDQRLARPEEPHGIKQVDGDDPECEQQFETVGRHASCCFLPLKILPSQTATAAPAAASTFHRLFSSPLFAATAAPPPAISAARPYSAMRSPSCTSA